MGQIKNQPPPAEKNGAAPASRAAAKTETRSRAACRLRRPWTVGLTSLGCPKNLVDSEIMLSLLCKAGVRPVSHEKRPDLLLINTCAFIAAAKKESLEAILEACAAKTAGKCRAVIVAGCLPQRYAAELQRELPEVDAFLGPDDVWEICRILEQVRRGGKRRDTAPGVPCKIIEPPADRMLLTGGPFAYLRIADGCDHRCSFCAIPFIRGRQRSRPVAKIVREAEVLLERGARELVLVAQDVAAYGKDLCGEAMLPALLRGLARLGGKFWVRLLYMHPRSITEEMLDAMAEDERVCRYLDVPVQHCHTEILHKMGRCGDAARLEKMFALIRRKLPGAALRTTCLVGFPGETDSHFNALLRFIKHIEFDHLGAFAYSREDGTKAASLPGQVPAGVARRRLSLLIGAQSRIMDRLAKRRLGRTEELLLERPLDRAGRTWAARSEREAPEIDGIIRVAAGPSAARFRSGEFIRARILAVKGLNIHARPASGEPA